MPFVVCKSNGGTLDDESFVNGYACGMIDVSLRLSKTLEQSPPEQTVRAVVLPQLDLIAMRNGYIMDVRKSKSPAWAYVSFDRDD